MDDPGDDNNEVVEAPVLRKPKKKKVQVALSPAAQVASSACRPVAVQYSNNSALITCSNGPSRKRFHTADGGKRLDEQDAFLLPSGLYRQTCFMFPFDPASNATVAVPSAGTVVRFLEVFGNDSGDLWPTMPAEVVADTKELVISRLLKQYAERDVSKVDPEQLKFGCHLVETAQATGRDVPLVVDSCIDMLQKFGVMEEGLFRVPGRTSQVCELRTLFEQGLNPLANYDPQTTNDWMTASSVAGCLKLYLRQLRDSVFTFALYSHFVEIGRCEMQAEMLARLREAVVYRLPVENLRVLQRLCPFLKTVADNSEINKMNSANLAMVFGPTLLPPPEEEAATALIRDGNAVKNIVKALIDHHVYLLTELTSRDKPNVADLALPPQLHRVRALYAYQSRGHPELSFAEGAEMVVYQLPDAEWWVGELDQQPGLVPPNYVEVLPSKPEEPESIISPVDETLRWAKFRIYDDESAGTVTELGMVCISGLPRVEPGKDNVRWHINKLMKHADRYYLLLTQVYSSAEPWRGETVADATVCAVHLCTSAAPYSYKEYIHVGEVLSKDTVEGLLSEFYAPPVTDEDADDPDNNNNNNNNDNNDNGDDADGSRAGRRKSSSTNNNNNNNDGDGAKEEAPPCLLPFVYGADADIVSLGGDVLIVAAGTWTESDPKRGIDPYALFSRCVLAHSSASSANLGLSAADNNNGGGGGGGSGGAASAAAVAAAAAGGAGGSGSSSTNTNANDAMLAAASLKKGGIPGSLLNNASFAPKLDPKYLYHGNTPTPPICVAVSRDSGITWELQLLKTGGACPCLVYDATSGVVGLSCGAVKFPRQGRCFVYSVDKGVTWSKPLQIGDESSPTSGCSGVVRADAAKFYLYFDVTAPYVGLDESACGCDTYSVQKVLIQVIKPS